MLEVGVIERGAVITDGRVIAAIGTESSVSRLLDEVKPEDIYDAGGRAVIPGFVDSHTHALFAGTREKEFSMRIAGKPYLEILQEGGGILESRRMLIEASDEEVLEQSAMRCKRMLAHGTTTAEIKSGYGLSTEQEIRSLRLINELGQLTALEVHPTFLGAHAIPPEYKDSRQDYVKLVANEMIPVVAEKKLARFCDVFCEKGVFDVEETDEIFQSALAHQLGLRLHADEIHPIGGTERACAMGAMSVDHLVAVTESGLEALRNSRTIATLLPGTSYSLMKSYAPARKMISMDIPIALATDCNPGSCYTESMPMIISLAGLMLKMSPEEALVASTFNAACSLGIQERVGSLEKGKDADLLILDSDDYRSLPYHFGVNPILRTMKSGEWTGAED
jgi:imidazolonepropionase